MNKVLNLSNNPKGAVVTAIAGLLMLMASGSLWAQYQGAETCSDSSCHREQYQQWLTSGHHFILLEDEPAESRGVPTPPGTIWDDFSFMVGGHKTKALFLDRDGYLYTPSSGNNQYNLLTGEFSDYRAGDSSVSYDCGSCHTTGYEPGGSPDDFPGISGTFALPGVECEHCHGPGLSMNEGDPEICQDCHNHGDESAIKASGGFIVSEGQHNEFMAGPHANNPLLPDGCVSCHNPHQKAEFGIKTECGTCHSEEASAYSGTLMDKVGVECIDCHMAPATLSAVPLGPNTGDMKSHIFYINTDPAANMFTQDGNNVALTDGKAAVTLDFVCQRCHQGASLEELAKFAKDFHDDDKDLEHVGLNPGLTGNWYNTARGGEGFVLEFGYSNDVLTLYVSFYTYDTMGNQIWLVALPTDGLTEGSTTVEVTVYQITGPMWGDDFDPGDRNTVAWGTGTFTFPSCSSASFTLTPGTDAQAAGYTELSYDLTRDLLAPGNACPTFVNNAE